MGCRLSHAPRAGSGPTPAAEPESLDWSCDPAKRVDTHRKSEASTVTTVASTAARHSSEASAATSIASSAARAATRHPTEASAVSFASAASFASFGSQYSLTKRRLGQGAFAKVRGAVHIENGQEFAVKVIDLRLKRGGEDRCRTKEFVANREIAMLRLVSQQEHCVRIVDGFMEGPRAYIVMEKCDQPLLSALESAEVNEPFYRKVFGQMLRALQGIHEAGVVHFDIKPENFVCTPGGPVPHVKLCDFGMATNAHVSGVRHVHGTAPYMAPELLHGQVCNEKVDVWSFAVLAYVLLLGRFPYQPEVLSAEAMKEAIAAGTPAPDFRPRPGLLPEGLEATMVTPAAVDFMASILKRNLHERKSAREALEDPWLHPPSEDEPSMPSLRLMLSSAKGVGAFSQVRRHRRSGTQPKGPARRGEARDVVVYANG